MVKRFCTSQVKPAAGRAERENKLFVGMMPRTATDADVSNVFGRFGDIREIYIIRDQDGSSRGCAFLKFKARSSALTAIRELNDKYTMEGAPRPLIVKFADNKRPQRKRDERMGVQQVGRRHANAREAAQPRSMRSHIQIALRRNANGGLQAYPQPYAQLALAAPQAFFTAAPGANPATLIPVSVGGAGGKVLAGGVGAPLMYYQPVVAPAAVPATQDGQAVQYVPYHPGAIPQQIAVAPGARYHKVMGAAPGTVEAAPPQPMYQYPHPGHAAPAQAAVTHDTGLSTLEASFRKVRREVAQAGHLHM
eukprot:scaffold707_cov240-Pinguiococcus_pyrenoidosus.AAC.16